MPKKVIANLKESWEGTKSTRLALLQLTLREWAQVLSRQCLKFSLQGGSREELLKLPGLCCISRSKVRHFLNQHRKQALSVQSCLQGCHQDAGRPNCTSAHWCCASVKRVTLMTSVGFWYRELSHKLVHYEHPVPNQLEASSIHCQQQ